MTSGQQLPKVFVDRGIPLPELARLRQHCHVTVEEKEGMPTREEFLARIPGVDAMLGCYGARIDKEALDIAGPQLKVFCTLSAGLDHVDLDLCKERGVKVGYIPDVPTVSTSELAITLLLSAARRLPECIHAVKAGVWGTRWENALWLAGTQVSGSVVGIVGLGRIGSAIAKRLATFEVSRIIYTGHAPKPDSADPIGAEFVTFDELLRQSDFVVVSCSLNESNKGVFNAEAFAKMKPTSVFVNVARGVMVDQEALYEALRSGQIGAAGLDVTVPEPLPTSHPLLTLPNCLIVPHMGCSTAATRNAMWEIAVDNILAGLQGRPLKHAAF